MNGKEDDLTPLVSRDGGKNVYGTQSNLGLSNKDKNTRLLFCSHGKPVESCFGVHHEHESLINVTDTNHCHSADQKSRSNARARRKLIIASILCLLFMIGEVIGGYLSNSLAIATDAAHLLTDFASFMISLFSLWVASRPATRGMSFGWYRAEVIGALTSVLLIWVITGILVYLAVERLITKDFTIDAKIMLITSAVGVAVNIIMGVALHEHGHTHGGSSHSHDENINVRAAFIHILGDLVQSVGVFIAAIIIYFKPEYIIADPICTFLFSGIVLLTTYTIIKDAMMVLMEGKPTHVDFEEVKKSLSNIDDVMKVHNIRIWALSLDKIAISAHLAVKAGTDQQKILDAASASLKKGYDFFEITLQVEQFQELMDDCVQCKVPEK